MEQGAKAVADGMKKLAESNPELAQSPEVQQRWSQANPLPTAQAGSMPVRNSWHKARRAESRHIAVEGAGKLSAGANQLAEGGKQLATGGQESLAGAKQLSAGQSQLVDGMKLFGTKLSEAATGGKQLASGATTLSQGTQRLQEERASSEVALQRLPTARKSWIPEPVSW